MNLRIPIVVGTTSRPNSRCGELLSARYLIKVVTSVVFGQNISVVHGCYRIRKKVEGKIKTKVIKGQKDVIGFDYLAFWNPIH